MPSRDLLAVGSLFAWTAYFLFVKRRRLDGVPAFAFMTTVITTGAVVFLPYALLTAGDLDAARGTDFSWLLVLIVGPGALGHGLMTWSHRYLNVNVASVLTLTGPVVSIVAAWTAYDEALSAGPVAGAVLVLVAVGAVREAHRRIGAESEPAGGAVT